MLRPPLGALTVLLDMSSRGRRFNMGEPGTDAKHSAGEADRPLSPAARRALAEAEERRKAAQVEEPPAEVGGPAGPEPTRFGDWERKGIASDF